MHLYISGHICVYMHAYMRAYVNIMYMCSYIYIYIYVYIAAFTHAHTHVYIAGCIMHGKTSLTDRLHSPISIALSGSLTIAHTIPM